jgi:hypothetical protein
LAIAVAILLLWGPSTSAQGSPAGASASRPADASATQLSSGGSDGLPWNDHIVATFYGESSDNCWGGYGNRLHPATDYFCALPATGDSLNCLGGKMACRIDDCGDENRQIDTLLNAMDPAKRPSDAPFEYWPSHRPNLGKLFGWVIQGTEGDGLFRVIQIKPSGEDGPVLEAYVGDVGPWCQDDAYWENGARPDAEDGIDSHGRTTNHAGIDLSYALAKAFGCTGIMHVDWRWKTIDGAYVVSRRPTEWR